MNHQKVSIVTPAVMARKPRIVRSGPVRSTGTTAATSALEVPSRSSIRPGSTMRSPERPVNETRSVWIVNSTRRRWPG